VKLPIFHSLSAKLLPYLVQKSEALKLGNRAQHTKNTYICRFKADADKKIILLYITSNGSKATCCSRECSFGESFKFRENVLGKRVCYYRTAFDKELGKNLGVRKLLISQA